MVRQNKLNTGMDHPKVSIIAISYNHEKYIRQAFDSFLAQKTDFDFEVVIGDDNSTDGTQQIIDEYLIAHPSLFRQVQRKKNVGLQRNFADTMERASGDYLALCECDDYWTDPLKLQKQVDFLDSNPDYSLCFHPVKVVFENTDKKYEIFPSPQKVQEFTLEKLLRQNFIQTNSVMYRRQSYDTLPTNILPVDWYLHLYHAQFGKIGFINRTMAVYRRHEGGVWWAKNRDEFWKKNGIMHLNMYKAVLQLFKQNPRYLKIIYEPIGEAFQALAELKVEKEEDDVLKEALVSFPEMSAEYFRITERYAREKEALTATHIKNLEEIIQGDRDYIKKMEADYHFLSRRVQELDEELKTAKNSVFYKIERKLKSLVKFRSAS